MLSTPTIDPPSLKLRNRRSGYSVEPRLAIAGPDICMLRQLQAVVRWFAQITGRLDRTQRLRARNHHTAQRRANIRGREKLRVGCPGQSKAA